MEKITNVEIIYGDAHYVALDSEEGATPSDVNRLVLVIHFQQHRSIIQYIIRQKDGHILIRTSASQSDFFIALMRTKHINGHQVSPYCPTEYHMHRRVIQHPELKYLVSKSCSTRGQGVISAYKQTTHLSAPSDGSCRHSSQQASLSVGTL